MARNKQKQREPFEAAIESLSHDGRGIAHINGKTAFIQNALPGETVIATLVKRHGKFDEAVAHDILTASPNRVTPPCEHYEMCGGCSMQHLATAEQIKHKESVLLNQLKHFGNLSPREILPPLTGPTLGYRRKARLGVRYVIKKEKLLVGFREKNGRYIAEISHCPILDPHIGEKITALQNIIASLTQYDQIPQVEVAIGETHNALIFRHLKPLTEEDEKKLCEFAKAENFDIYLQSKGPDTIHKIWPIDKNDRLIYTLPNQDITMQFHPADFTQVNQSINPKMVCRAIELLDPQPTDNILDLFCGLGNFTIPIAKLCQSITGVEGSATALERAHENKQLNQITNASFQLANLAESIAHFSWAKRPYDKVLIDPPRSGAEIIMQYLQTAAPEKILYISCNPATLARDAGILTQNGLYSLEKAGVMDMFPHTSHVESIALFLRK